MTQSSDVAKETFDTTQHDTAGMHMLVVLFVLSYCAS